MSPLSSVCSRKKKLIYSYFAWVFSPQTLFALVIQRKIFTGLLTSNFFATEWLMICFDAWCFGSDWEACKITVILFVCNILDLEWSCGQHVGVEGDVIGKTSWIRSPANAQTQCYAVFQQTMPMNRGRDFLENCICLLPSNSTLLRVI